VLAADIWPDLLDDIRARAAREQLGNVETVLAKLDDPRLPRGAVDVVCYSHGPITSQFRRDLATLVDRAVGDVPAPGLESCGF